MADTRDDQADEGHGREERESLPVYMISVAAQLARVHPQTLRIYERRALICPRRTAGGTRVYSDVDVARVRLIQELTQDLGLNLAGVERVMRLQDEIESLKDTLDEMQARVAEVQGEMIAAVRAAHAEHRSEIVLFRPQHPARRLR